MTSISLFPRLVLVALLWSFALVAQAQPETALSTLISNSQARLQADDARDALNVLLTQQGEYAGNPEYDYWLGFMAVRAGEPAQATFALERLLLEQPDHAAARLELAQAYLQLGQKEAAANELDQLAQMNPPKKARERMALLREQVGRQQAFENKKKQAGFITVEAGHDNNVGTWPEGTLNALPGAPSITPIHSTYGSLQGGYRHQFDLTATQHLELSMAGMIKRHDRQPARQFEQDYYQGGLNWVKDIGGRHELVLGASSGTLRLDDVTYYRQIQLLTQWRYQLSQTQRTRLGLTHRNANYDARIYDHTGWVLEAGLETVFNPRWTWDVSLTGEYADAGRRRPGGDSRRYQARSLLSYKVRPRHELALDLAWTRTSYQSEYAQFVAFNLFPENRLDNGPTASLQWGWSMGDWWQLRTRVQYRKQHSTMNVYRYDQTLGSMALTRYF